MSFIHFQEVPMILHNDPYKVFKIPNVPNIQKCTNFVSNSSKYFANYFNRTRELIFPISLVDSLFR